MILNRDVRLSYKNRIMSLFKLYDVGNKKDVGISSFS